MTTTRIVTFVFALSALTALSAPSALLGQEATIKPGQSEAEVRASWGDPLIVRKSGDYTYMYYQNGCLKTCGTYDVVMLERDQVIDAIVRATNHHYDGVSSSPPDRKPEMTLPVQ